MNFGRWHKVSEMQAPALVVAFQIRLDQGPSGLIDYPRGKSAMVYYGGGAEVHAELAKLQAACTAAEWDRLWIRFSVHGSDEKALELLKKQFMDRFGALPLLHGRVGP